MDRRERVARAHAESGSSAEVAETFGCGESWVRRVSQRLRETGGLAARSTARADDQRAFDDDDDDADRGEDPRALIRERPDATLAGVVEAVGKPACPRAPRQPGAQAAGAAA
jgi:transposase